MGTKPPQSYKTRLKPNTCSLKLNNIEIPLEPKV